MDLKLVNEKMDSSLKFFEKELSTIRTSRGLTFRLDAKSRGSPRAVHKDEISISMGTGKGEVEVTGSKNYLTIHAKYSLSPDQVLEGETKVSILMEPGKIIRPVFEYLRLGPLEIPILFISRITSAKLSLQPTPGWPFITNIKRINISSRKLEINPNI